jgi:CheY-like chemotaxis protein
VAHILIIDDDSAVGLTLSRMLESEGYAVSRVENGPAGLEHVAASPPDAILLDMRMPAMSGLEFLRRLRGVPHLSDVPVGIVTGDYFLSDAVLAELDALRAQIRYKPVWMEDLSALVRSLLGDTGQTAE